MSEKRETGNRPGPNAKVCVTVDLMVDHDVIAVGERLTCLWFTDEGHRMKATVRRERDGRLFSGVPVSVLTWHPVE